MNKKDYKKYMNKNETANLDFFYVDIIIAIIWTQV